MTTSLKDSGSRHQFSTGAVRDIREGKGRFDLLSYDALHQLACVFEAGAKKYSERNWESGIPVSRHIDSAIRHLLKAASGADDEQHLPLAMWNISAAIQTYIWASNGKLPQSLVDRPMELFDCESFTQPVVADTTPDPEPPIDFNTHTVNGHKIMYINKDSGLVDGCYYQGMDFKVAIRRANSGAKCVDDEVEMASAELAKQAQENDMYGMAPVELEKGEGA